MLRGMIRVTISTYNDSVVDVHVDADDAAIVSPTAEVLGDDILVLEKAGKEVAWFRSWTYAVKEENLSE